MPQFLPVVSSALTAVKYDRETSTLVVQFQEGVHYEYTDVPSDVVLDVLFADSIGKALDALVKKAGFKYRRLSSEDV